MARQRFSAPARAADRLELDGWRRSLRNGARGHGAARCAPALLPTLRLRLAGGVALIAAWSIALDVRPYALGTVLSRTGRGFLDFYDVLVPFDALDHRLMHGVVLLAVFVFTALAALAVAARRPLLASLALVAGAGWPATIFPGHDDLGRGVVLLLAALALVARLGPTTRRGGRQCCRNGARGHGADRPSWNGVAKAQFLLAEVGSSSKAGPSVNVDTSGRRTTAALTSRRSGRACSPSRPMTCAPSTGGRRRSTRSSTTPGRKIWCPWSRSRCSWSPKTSAARGSRTIRSCPGARRILAGGRRRPCTSTRSVTVT